MDLKCMGPLTCRYFSVVNTTVPHSPWLVEFRDVKESRTRKAYYINYMQINPHVVQGSTLPSITRDYYEQLYANKIDNLEKWMNS